MSGIDFKTGDLVLCKVASYPKWPAIVFPQRLLGKDVYRERKPNKICVCFFNDLTYSWASPSRLEPLTKKDIEEFLNNNHLKKTSINETLIEAYRDADEFRNLNNFIIQRCTEEDRLEDLEKEEGNEIESGEDPFIGINRRRLIQKKEKLTQKKSSTKDKKNKINDNDSHSTHPGTIKGVATKKRKLEKSNKTDDDNNDDDGADDAKSSSTDGNVETMNGLSKKKKLKTLSTKSERSDSDPNDMSLAPHIITVDKPQSDEHIASPSTSISDTSSKSNSVSVSNSTAASSPDTVSSLTNSNMDTTETEHNNGNIHSKKKGMLDSSKKMEITLLLRSKIQKLLVQREDNPTDDDLREAHTLFKRIKKNLNNNPPVFDIDSLRTSKLHKLFKVIGNTESLAEFHPDCKEILLVWSNIINQLKIEKKKNLTIQKTSKVEQA
ncbi:hypothetical protein TBLA_0E00850 [Henningerozyma blattae CBS 6284]|uniref:PWWP domain-containing protein n=1 Tax=Henningerozyma blattae (strain ATCC 34711 / CBS 6284 / DSM 70876 / NBRC 10599 / NRRL Y-10934 / UCD 77-7) TaxID=1071380 RepID=I2H444_HENB6|nr:hypothetical protein TBLA_0E00850 [Tetrapisispora blattae CBS 6284]CCH61146.1 hypothetical protein TBLA_0E00850 [Tetrapisispora blattae CBS 6284]